nr:uncharacterized protein LOC129282933 [Lytechinus pictus]
MAWDQKEFETRFPHDFPSYDAAAEALDTVTSYLVDKGELDSVIETEVALGFFKGVITRKPLLNATVNEAKSFLNKTSEALNVLFSNKTNEHLARACVEKRNLSASPEEIQYELEGLLYDASELIAGGGLSSFDVSRENAAIAIAPTSMTSRGNSATAAECGGALGITGYGAEIPCEVLKEMGSRAVYQMRLPFGADALASSKCSENRLFDALFLIRCFLSLDDLSLLFLMVPIAIIILFNLFVMVRVVRQIAKMADGPTLQSDVKSRVRHGVKAIFVLLPIMGLTWVFAFLAIERASVAFQYIFVISNSFQGVFIFFVHFIRNSEVRHAVKRRRDRWLVSQSRQGDYKVKNTKKTSSSGVDKTSSSLTKSPEQTLTLMNMNTELVYGGDIPDKNGN